MPRRNLSINPCVQCGTEKSDMMCPLVDSLSALIEGLADQGYEAHFNEIDAQMARSLLTQCTNCGARG
jgi:hypothetical protein